MMIKNIPVFVCILLSLICLILLGYQRASVLALEQDKEAAGQDNNCLGMKHGEMVECFKVGEKAFKRNKETRGKLQRTDSAAIWQAPEEFTQKENPYIRDEKSIAIGKVVYSFNCSGCHGVAGHGSGEAMKAFGMDSPDLTVPSLKEKSDGDLLWKVTEGKWPMPAFWEGDVLSESDLWHLINYVRSLSFTNVNE